jgi:hypothetical protein
MKGLGLIILVMSIMLTACGKKEKKEPISLRGARGPVSDAGAVPTSGTGSTPGTYQPASGKTWGEITRGTFYTQNQFNDLVRYFTSATLNLYADPPEIGFVSGDSNQSTGIRFWGQVATTTAFNPTASVSAQVSGASSELRIVIWDAYAGQTNAAGQTIPEYPVHIKGNATGTISGNHAIITFNQPGYGTITLDGTFDQNNFQGWARFANEIFWDGQKPGAANYLGQFRVSTCGFFNCQ